MKAHLELTELELDLIRLYQEKQSLQFYFKEVLNYDGFKQLDFVQTDLPTPKLDTQKINKIFQNLDAYLCEASPSIKSEIDLLNEAEYLTSLAKWSYAPDFQIQYQKSISGQQHSSMLSLGITIPLWFWKQNAYISFASYKKTAQKFKVDDLVKKTIAVIKDLNEKVNTELKMLNIYETSLIPQAQGAYNGIRAAYQAGKTSFLDLLESERSLYKVKTKFYETLNAYVEHLSQLETHLGSSISDLP